MNNLLNNSTSRISDRIKKMQYATILITGRKCPDKKFWNKILSGLPYRLVISGFSTDLIKLMKKTKPDLILLEADLVTDIEIHDEITTLCNETDKPVIGVFEKKQKNLSYQLIDMGMADVILKPVNRLDLIITLDVNLLLE